MAYNTKPIVKDVDGNPISQYYNPDTDSYEPVEGSHGANKVLVENNDLSLIPILDKLSQLTGTVIDEETRKINELERIDNEDTRKSNELERIENEDTRQFNEDIRIESENTRITNENIRKSNELERIDNEDTRQSNEDIRNTNEIERVNNEDIRKSNELQRIDNEDARQSNEETRKQNEIVRQNTETTREDNENIRQSNESTRQSNENARIEAENVRKNNEDMRITNENNRKNNETERITAEQARENAENERQSNELIRQQNESIRQSNEDLRITLYNDLLEKVASGYFKGEKGETGNGLEYMWDGTKLGIRVEGETEYVFVDLRGPQGPAGDIDNLTTQHIETALGYTPVNKAGDTMTGDLKVNGNVVAGTEYIVGYDGTSESLQRFKFKYNGSTGYLELWRYSNDTGWTLCATFPNRNTGSGGLTVEGKAVAFADHVNTALANKVDNSRVLTDVPANAKFTDTIIEVVDDINDASSTKALSARQGFLLLENMNNLTTNLMTHVIGLDYNMGVDIRLKDLINNFDEHLAEKATQDKYGHIRLQDIPNPEVATQAEAEAGTNNTKMMTPLRTSQALDSRIKFFDDGTIGGKQVQLLVNGKWMLFQEVVDVSELSWAEVQQIVRAGKASEYFSIGDQLISEYDGGEIIWEVIGIDVDTPADSQFTHSMTLQTKDCLHNIPFDAPEPNNPNSDRRDRGNNRYIHSAVKQWLNSSESKFQWKSQHQYDAKPTSSLDLYDGAGFLYRLDPELVSVLGAVNKKVAKANIDGGGQDTFSDKVFLLSRVEVGLGTEGTTTDEFVYPYYSGIENAGRIKTLDGSPRTWWLRSPNVSNSYDVRYVNSSGEVYYYYARGAYGLSPACVIV